MTRPPLIKMDMRVSLRWSQDANPLVRIRVRENP
jgi:hypothetical protein